VQPFDVAAFGAQRARLVLEVEILDVERENLLATGPAPPPSPRTCRNPLIGSVDFPCQPHVA
jgi:hypothetical protein